MEGWYVVGSAALDDFRPGASDIDFVAVTATPPADHQLAALEGVHTRLPCAPNPRRSGAPRSA
ncbi:nucleotidyltransferase domain-containing protein [Frankia sp. Cj3]|uniref:nucleotidyltransferase domain-containing protein n=1 Tax=Frankia sp. Cj3 TaxID=2880976 RepID=UPI00351CDF0A